MGFFTESAQCQFGLVVDMSVHTIIYSFKYMSPPFFFCVVHLFKKFFFHPKTKGGLYGSGGTSIAIQWYFNGNSMALKLHFNSASSTLYWHFNGTSTTFQPHFNATSMALQQHCNGIKTSAFSLKELPLISLELSTSYI